MKKAQGMSLKVIVVAAIALIVLAVLVVLFTGNAKFDGSDPYMVCIDECTEIGNVGRPTLAYTTDVGDFDMVFAWFDGCMCHCLPPDEGHYCREVQP